MNNNWSFHVTSNTIVIGYKRLMVQITALGICVTK